MFVATALGFVDVGAGDALESAPIAARLRSVRPAVDEPFVIDSRNVNALCHAIIPSDANTLSVDRSEERFDFRGGHAYHSMAPDTIRSPAAGRGSASEPKWPRFGVVV